MLRRLILEIHRRSLWQVLAIFVATGWAVLQVMDVLINHGVLPDWVFKAGLVLLLMGLPIVLATAFVQEGMRAPDETQRGGEDATSRAMRHSSAESVRKRHRLFTWRNAILGGVGAFALLGFASAGYMGMRTLGIGAPGTLAAQGVFGERESVVLAEFGNATADSELGRIVTEALRVDLLESSAVSVLPGTYVASALQRTGRQPGTPLTPELAREIAIRDGIKAFVQGDVGDVGTGYVITASIVEAATGAPLAAFRETASSESDLLRAVDRISARIRGKAGESLRSVRASEPLSAVTTSSLDALRAFTTAYHNYNSGDRQGSIRLLKSAIELDPEFAMAHRRLSVELSNMGSEPERMRSAAQRAYELRTRLGTIERLHTEAWYHIVNGDRDRANDAYRQILRTHPDEPVAVNNLAAFLYRSRADAEEAITLYQRGLALPTANSSMHVNLANMLWVTRRDDEAAAAAAVAAERYPQNYAAARMTPLLLALQHRWEAADSAAQDVLTRFAGNVQAPYSQNLLLGGIDAARGRLREARSHMNAAARHSLARGEAGWYYNVTTNLAYAELLLAGSPDRAATVLRELEREHPFDAPGVPASSAGMAALVAALAGDRQLGARARAAMDAHIAAHGAGVEDQAILAVADWAAAFADGDHAAALAALDRFGETLHGRCEGRRCDGNFERGLTLEQAGRIDEAIAAYEASLGGMPMGVEFIAAMYAPLALERLGELYDRQGNAAKAAEYYARFAALWQNADAELQPRVRRAQQRAAALRGSG